MNPEQLNLGFEADLSTEAHWIFRKKGLEAAVGILIDLLNKGVQEIKFEHIAAIDSGLQPDESVPPKKVPVFHGDVEKIHDNRYWIKEEVERLSEYRLVIVGSKGQSARMNGRGSAAGFALRNSAAGIEDHKAQVKMGLGAAKSALRKTPQLRDDPDVQALLAGPALIGNGNDEKEKIEETNERKGKEHSERPETGGCLRERDGG